MPLLSKVGQVAKKTRPLVRVRDGRHLCSSSYRILAVPRTRTTLGDRNSAEDCPCETVYWLL